MIDGEYPFIESQNIYFHRLWEEEGEPHINTIGDEVNPKQVQLEVWQTQLLYDGFGNSPRPLLFYLEAGEHEITLAYVAEPLYISKIELAPYEAVPDYEQVQQLYRDKGYRSVSSVIELQAENTVLKTDPTLRRIAISDPAAVPFENGYRRLNGVGDWRWRLGGQEIYWEIEVPQSGLYTIGMKVAQWWGDGLPTFRRIKIDGQTPFSELLEYTFDYDRDFRNEILGDDRLGNYQIYLEQGRHEFSMVVQIGPFAEVAKDLTFDALKFSTALRQIVMITGQEPDPNFEYELDENIPGLIEEFVRLKASMELQIDRLMALSDRRPVAVNNFAMVADLLTELIEYPESIPKKLKDLENAQKNIGSWLKDLQQQPLLIDYFAFGPEDLKMDRATSTVLQRTSASVANFFRSFVKDYDSIGGLLEEDEADVTIDVWIARGKEWAELIKELADETFTPQTGIAINLNVLPASQLNAGPVNALLLSILSGNAPDVALGTDDRSPVEFAIRGASYDLTSFPDFDEVLPRFLPGVMEPFKFDGGIYALPETMDFNVLIYRKDILNELGVRIPDTMEQLYGNLLPVLRENGMDFYYPRQPGGLLPFLYQNGGEYYIEEGTKTGLGEPQAFAAFKEWTELYTNYKVPVQAEFYNRMRTGTIPIGVGNYYAYVLLSTAAPELKGRWSIAPMPGHKRPDGTIDRSAGGSPSASVILSQTDEPDASWQFLKWWTSEEVQSQFGRELEALMGVEARWNTANIKAFQSLPWDPDHIDVITEQWKFYREQPYVIGGYFTMRHIDNAWNRVVLGTMGVRDSLEKAVKDINRELEVKQEEFDYHPQMQN